MKSWLFLILISLPFSVWANALVSNFCDQWYLSFPNSKNVQPKLNVEKVYKTIEEWRVSKFRNQLQVKKIGQAEGENLLRLNLPSSNPLAKKILITAGVHGNEPFGVTALMEFIEKTVFDQALRNQYDFVFLPMLNPKGLKLSTRLTGENIDLNRTFSTGEEIQASKIVEENLTGEKFDLAIDLHGSNIREGFFIISSKNADPMLALKTIQNFEPQFILQSTSGNYPDLIPSVTDPTKIAYRLIEPGIATSYNQGTLKDFFVNGLKVENAFTFEYPGQISVFDRQSQYVKLIQNMIKALNP
ncbi:MAG: DUF2817 domain-containing protein [Bacteriovoracaceae bacterium]